MSLFKTRNLIASITIMFILSGCGGGGTTQSIEEKTIQTETLTSETNLGISTESEPNIEATPQTEPILETIVEPIPAPKPIVEDSPVVEPEPTQETAVEPAPVIEPTPEPESTPVLEPEPTPETVVEPAPLSETIVEPIPAPKPIVEDSPVVEPEPTPVVEPEPTPVVEPEPTPVVEPEPTQETAVEPAPVIEPTPEPETTPVVEPEPTPETAVEPAPVIEPTPEPICISGLAMQQGQITDSSSGDGIADVLVTVDGCSTVTDINGFYTLTHIPESEEALVKFEKEGYLPGSTKIQIKELSGNNTPSINYLEYSIYAHDYQWDHDSTEEISSPRIAIDTSVSYVNKQGTKYSGPIKVELTILDTDENKLLDTFPGSFEGMNTNGEMVPFVSYGLISLSFKEANGDALNLISDNGATLTFKAIPSSIEENIIPLWYYDYEQGLWIEEGYAELQSDGTYKADISHSGTWGMNKPIETDLGIYRGRILNAEGLPISDVRLQAIGNNWISKDLSTDENGVFEIEVIPGESFQLTAYNYQEKYSAAYTNVIPAIASGVIVE